MCPTGLDLDSSPAPRSRPGGLSRRAFAKFCGAMAATLALPATYSSAIASALLSNKRPVLVWLEFQDCAGCTESVLRSEEPGIGEIVLDLFTLRYHETLRAPSVWPRPCPASKSSTCPAVRSMVQTSPRRSSTI